MTTEKRFLKSADILAADDLARTQVWIPEWKGHIYVRMLTAKERDEIQEIWAKYEDKKDAAVPEVRSKVILLVSEDGEKKPLFKADEIPALMDKSAVAVERIFDAAMALAKATKDDLERAMGNLPGGQKEGSPTD